MIHPLIDLISPPPLTTMTVQTHSSTTSSGLSTSRPDFALSTRFKKRKPATGKGGRPELTDEQRQEIKEAFDLFDTDHSGSIDYHELKVAMRALGFDVRKPEVLKLMKEYDRNQTGQIEYVDFVDIMTQKMAERDPDEEIRKAFALFDDDHTGYITVKNLRRVVRELVRIAPRMCGLLCLM